MRQWPLKQLGGLAAACWGVHAIALLRAGQPYELFWAGNAAGLLIAAGALLRRPGPAAVGVLWLALSIPLWMLDVALGGEFMASTAAAYVGGLIAGAAILKTLKLPPRAWKTAAVSLLILQQFCRFTTPVRENVNFCVLMWYGWAGIFKSYTAFWLWLAALSAAIFGATDFVLRRWLRET